MEQKKYSIKELFVDALLIFFTGILMAKIGIHNTFHEFIVLCCCFGMIEIVKFIMRNQKTTKKIKKKSVK